MAKIFPKDCDNTCEHFDCYDMSIDDLVYKCYLLGYQVDGDSFWINSILCPLKLGEKQ